MGNANSITTNSTAKKGYLLKYESKQLRMYFAVLADDTLTLYEHESADDIIENIHLPQFSNVEMYANDQRTQLKLITNGAQNELVFNIPSYDVDNDWFKHIKSAIFLPKNARKDKLFDDEKMEITHNVGRNIQNKTSKSSKQQNIADIDSKKQNIEDMKYEINEKDKELTELKMKILEMENEKLKRQKAGALKMAQKIKKKAEEEEKKAMDKDKEIEILRKESGFVTLWQWKENNNQWIPYHNEMSKKIEKLAINKNIQYKSSKNGQTYKITKISEKAGMQINVTTNKKREIKRMKTKIDAFILEKKKLEEKAEDIGYIIKWQWDQTPSNVNATWKEYPDEINKKIEMLDINGSFEFMCNDNGQKYKITKQTKHTVFQINVKSKVQRGCRRFKKKIENVVDKMEKYKARAMEKESEYNSFKEKVGFEVIWQIDENNDNKYVNFSDGMMQQIEQLQIGEVLTFDGCYGQYTIQRTTKNKAVEWEVTQPLHRWPCRRIEKASGLNQVEYPQWWSKKKTSEYAKPNIITLSYIGCDFKEIKEIFDKTATGYKINAIEGVKNEMLYNKYWNERESVIKSIGKHKLNEKYLFHGTRTEDVMDSVMVQGFRKEFNKTSKWGKGTYFARDALYSIKYAAKDTFFLNEYKIFACKVIVGEQTAGNAKYELTSWPKKQNGLLYDSLVDNLYDPTIYVIHENVRAYPMFLIHFEKKSKKK